MNRLGYCLGVLLMMIATITFADPPARVARLKDIRGEVSLLPNAEEEWVSATRNRPLTIGDRLWNDADSKANLQMGNSSLCIGDNTSVTILNLDDKTVQLQLQQGSVNLFVKTLKENQNIEIDTPNLAFLVSVPGYYRLDVDEQGTATNVHVFDGEATVYGKNKAYIIDQNQAYRFEGEDLENYQPVLQSIQDPLTAYCDEQLKKHETPKTSQYVSQVMGPGAQYQ